MFSLFINYTKWHYSYALLNIFRLAKELLRFFFNLFSIPLFLKSLFSPIFSLPVSDVYSSEIGDLVESFLGGILTRVLGAIFRLAFIFLGLVCCVLVLIFSSVILVVWISIPGVVVGLLCCVSFFILSLL